MDYIHLNPVMAGIVAADRVADFRWSSLARLVKGTRPEWLCPSEWLQALGLADCPRDWKRYVADLQALANDPQERKDRGFDELTRDWAIGSHGWKQALAREYGHRALELDLPRDETFALKAERWTAMLETELKRCGKDSDAVVRGAKSARWKVEIALALRKRCGAPYRWIAQALAMGSPLAVRVAVCRLANG